MIIPDSIKFGGHTIKIQRHSPELNDRHGFFDCRFNMISICTDSAMSESKEAEVFLHELIELANYNFELKIPHQSICALSELLFSVIRENNLDFRSPDHQDCFKEIDE